MASGRSRVTDRFSLAELERRRAVSHEHSDATAYRKTALHLRRRWRLTVSSSGPSGAMPATCRGADLVKSRRGRSSGT